MKSFGGAAGIIAMPPQVVRAAFNGHGKRRRAMNMYSFFSLGITFLVISLIAYAIGAMRHRRNERRPASAGSSFSWG